MTTQPLTLNGGWTGFQGVDGDDAAAATTDLINILDAVDVPIVVVRRNSVIACFNKAAADILGLAPSDLGRPSRDVLALASVPCLEEQCREVVAGGLASRTDFLDGDKRFVVRISPYTEGDGQVTGAVLTFANVTAFRASIDQAIYERECTKAILNTVADPLVVLSADLGIQSGNRAFYRMFQVSRDESQGVPIYELGNGAFERTPLRTQLKELLAESHEFRPFEAHYFFPEEGQRTLILDARTLFLPGHSERRVLVTFQDITARKQAEAANDLRAITERKRSQQELRRSEAFLAEAQRLSLTGSFSWRVAADEIRWSEQLYRIYEFDQGMPVTLERINTRVHPEDVSLFEKMAEHVRGGGSDFEWQYRLMMPDRSIKYLRAIAHATRDEDGQLEYIAAVQDVTERKRAERAWRESEAKFRDYAETASDWLWEIGPDYKFTLLTENAFGSDPARRIGTACWDHALDLETEPEKWRLVRATLDSRRPFRDFVYCSLGGNRSPMYVKASGKPVFDVEGEFRGYRGTGTDVTAIVRAQRAEESLRTVQAELAHVSRVTTLGQLTASIAHEVNQPIGAALINAQTALRWLSRQPPDAGRATQAIDRVVNDCQRAADIVSRTRDLVKKSPPRKDVLEINEAILEVIELTRGEMSKSGVRLQTQLAESLPAIPGDRVQLQQVILNLVMNAVEAMSEMTEGKRELLINTQTGERCVLVAVRDSGPGLSEVDLERVFEAFYTTKSSGLGIGLSICRSIAEAHGGRLWATANVPKGAAFQFALPINSDRSDEPEQHASVEPKI